MLNLLTAERIKLFNGKKIWIVLGILFLFPVYQAINSIFLSYGSELEQAIDIVINGATGVLMIKKNGLTILLVISVFISFFIGDEFQNGTIRNALSLGRSRTHYYLSKFVIAALVSFVAVVGMTILGMVGYTIVFGFGEVDGMNHYFSYAMTTFSVQYLLILSNISVYVMISFLAKRVSISIIWSFLYTIITGFLPGIFQHTEHFKDVTFWFTETFLFYLNFATHADLALYPKMILVSILTVVISSILGMSLFRRTDIK